MKKRIPRIELDTPIVPRAIAAAVLEEASLWFDEPLPGHWIRQLTARANAVYACNPRFRGRIATRDNAGRDRLWAFTRHWLSDLIRRHRPHLHARLPSSLQRWSSVAAQMGRACSAREQSLQDCATMPASQSDG